jgi:DNA-binding transcriptional regulator GbsR (MarR family)
MDSNTMDDKVRKETLASMEDLLTILVERYGRRTTLGEVLAVYAALHRMCSKDRVTIAEIAEATGLPKQSLSRWAQKRLGESIVLNINEDDQRVHDVRLVNREAAAETLSQLAEVLGTSGR